MHYSNLAKTMRQIVALIVILSSGISCIRAMASGGEGIGQRIGTPLVVDGQAGAVVVLPVAPSSVAKYAAEELVYHVEKATGAKLTVVEEGREPNGPLARVYIGPTAAAARAGIDAKALSPDEFVLRGARDSLCIAGRDSDGKPLDPDTWAGTLFGVYEVLENVMGVRWLWPGELGEHVPPTKSIVIPAMDKIVAPRLIIRRLRSTLDGRPGAAGGDTFSPEALKKARADEGKWLRRQRMGHSRKMRWGHAFTTWWKQYGGEHPDWFNLLDGGKRGPQYGDRGDRAGMCVSNPGFHAQIIENWLKECTANPDNKPNINGCENDVFGRCGCERCRAWDPPRPDEGLYPERFSKHGIVSDRYARFWRTLQELASKHDPDAIVTGYAYVNYAPPPVRETLNEHVWIGLVPDSFFPRSEAEHEQCLAMWQGWAKTGCRLFLRPNYTLEGYCMPFIYAHQFADEFAHHARNGMIATDFDSLTAMWATQGPQVYLFARWQSCLDKTADEVLAEYYGAFGPAAKGVEAYFNYWENYTMGNRERFRATEKKMGANWASYPRLAHECFTPEAFAGGRELLDAAAEVAGADALAAARVAFLGKGLAHAEKCAAVSRARASGDFIAAQEALSDLRAYRRHIEKDNVANLAFCASLESRAFESKGAREVAYGGQPLKPIAGEVAPASIRPVSLRGDFGMIASLGAGESFRATISIRKIGKTNLEPARWSLYSAKRQPLAKGDIDPGKAAELEVAVPSGGICNLVLSTSRNAGQVTLLNDHAVILGRELALLGESGPLYFYVPPKTKAFTITLTSPGPGETARATVIDPSGREVATGHTVETPKVDLKIEVPPGQDGTAWSVAPSRAPKGTLEDYAIALGDNLPPYWAQSQDRLLVPAK